RDNLGPIFSTQQPEPLTPQEIKQGITQPTTTLNSDAAIVDAGFQNSMRIEMGLKVASIKAALLNEVPGLEGAGRSEAIVTRESEAISNMQSAFKLQFETFAADKDRFHSVMKQIYGTNYSTEQAEAFRQKALNHDYRWLPQIKFASSESVGATNGVFAQGPPAMIYMNEQLLNNPAEAAKAYTRAVGYHLDRLTNDPFLALIRQISNGSETTELTSEATGNEGELFRAALAGEPTTIENLTQENTIGLVVDGRAGLYEVI
ncbi:MAG TPA: hypothetical protein VLH08_14515, partial [Acidobacteriota bacterium]|nr:hypothetical protein [Acidobacteriota bacterium]